MSKKKCKRFYGLYGLNSGVVLMNLTRIRKGDFQSRLRVAMHTFQFFGDQDVYNHLFAEKNEVYVLPCQWNIRSDSRCAPKYHEMGILHGNRKLFHTFNNFSFFPNSAITLENFSSHFHRIGNVSWYNLKPNCLNCTNHEKQMKDSHECINIPT